MERVETIPGPLTIRWPDVSRRPQEVDVPEGTVSVDIQLEVQTPDGLMIFDAKASLTLARIKTNSSESQ